MANDLAADGYPITLVAGKLVGSYLPRLDPRVPTVDLGQPRAVRLLFPMLKWLRANRPGTVMSVLDHASVVLLMAASLTKTRVIVSLRNTLSVEYAGKPGRTDQTILRLARRLYPRAAVIHAVSHGVADDAATFLGIARDRFRVIYNPVITPEYLVQTDQPGPSRPRPYVLGVGRLAPQKGFDVLIRAFAQSERRQDSDLVILGEGEDRTALTELGQQVGIGDRLHLPGFAENPFPWMRDARVYVLSSRFEGLPGTLIQAMGTGCPVISTDCPSGPREVLQDGTWGKLVPVDAVESLASALDHPPAPAPPHAVDRFRAERVRGEYIDLLELAR